MFPPQNMRNALYRRRRPIIATVGVLVLAGLAGTLVAESWVALTLTLGALSGIVAGSILELRRTQVMLRALRDHVENIDQRVAKPSPREIQAARAAEQALQARVAELERSQLALAVSLYESLRAANGPSSVRLPSGLVPGVARALLERDDVLDAYALLASTDSLQTTETGLLRRLRSELKRRGYLTRALDVAQCCVELIGEESDLRTHAVIAGEAAVLSGSFLPAVPRASATPELVRGRVLHLVGNSLPTTQSGYTLRTHYAATAQRSAGLDPSVATQMGFDHDGDEFESEDMDGITYHRIPGPARGTEPLDTWMSKHVERVADLVRVIRPAIIHAASDFLNALTARAVGTAFGIPVVYESRGFWEETWLSRQADTFGWSDLDQLKETHGLPDVYLWRREIEDRARREADRVVTLAEVMADRIEAGGVPRKRITVVPNGVAVDAFPVLSRNTEVAAELGISGDTTVVGYISSIVEYEGIDTLIAAYAEVSASSSRSVMLLIVGEGLERERLMHQATALGLSGVVFTGRVPHDQVLDYYSLIDIFVVPRKPVDVSHLVTPLKPFEAFSTGRTVVLSNVRALATIAERSEAAELFEAGNAKSLAGVLLKLLEDPARRQELAAKGAAWVRAERTWAANAQVYLKLYEELQAIPRSELRIPRLTAQDIDVARLRKQLEQRPPLPFEQLSAEDAFANADKIMSAGWKLGSHPVVKLDLPIDWTQLCTSNRSWNFHLHAWDFLAPVLYAHSRTGERRYLDWSVDRAVSWATVFNEGDARGTMAWYDMALGLRGHRLAYLVEQAVLQGLDPAVTSVLLACVVRHQQEYFADRAFSARNNHGVYVALGELALARRLSSLPEMDTLERQGRERVGIMAKSQFAPDGGHVEHSPDYHRMLLDSFRGALNAGLVEDSDLLERLALAEDILGWLIQPNGELVQVGDSSARQMRSLRTRTSSPTTEFLGSGGSRGEPDSRTLLVLPDTGYAIIRSPQPTGEKDHEDSGYLFLAAGFHSQAHKHADDLAITWFDRGHEILIDAGRYGYVDLLPKDSPLRLRGFFYGAPERQYVESTRAHNTVETDGLDHVRRGRQPYGSAIRVGEERDGCFRLIADVDHGHWRHQRVVIFHPGQWLYVIDTLSALDGCDHDYRVWWNFPDEVKVGADHRRLDLRLASGDELWMSELGESGLISPASAQHDPMRGWRSKHDMQLTPAWSTGFEAIGVRDHEFRTLLCFNERLLGGPPDHPFSC